MAALLGLSAQVYRLTTGSRATWGVADSDGFAAAAAPSNLEVIGNVTDVSVRKTKSRSKVGVRSNGGWLATVGTAKDAEITINMLYDSGDADMTALHKAWNTNAKIALAVLDGDKATVGTKGVWADFEVLDITEGQPFEGHQTVDVVVAPGLSSVAPEIVKVTA